MVSFEWVCDLGCWIGELGVRALLEVGLWEICSFSQGLWEIET